MMKLVPHDFNFTVAWWLLHAVAIAAMSVCGMYLGQWLVAILMEPVIPGDLATEWWQIFRKFAAVASGSMFLAVLVGYVLLILPNN